MKVRILVIRGGALGDFIVTLPALALLRKTWPGAQIEILGKPSIACLAVGRHYADNCRSIEDPAFAPFYLPGVELPPSEAAYFSSFHLVVSWLSDPELVFQHNLQRCGLEPLEHGISPAEIGRKTPGYYLRGDSRIVASPAAAQLCAPLALLGLSTSDYRSRVYPNSEDRAEASRLLPDDGRRTVAIHPGSGSPRKNWPFENWKELMERMSEELDVRLVLTGGEAESELLPQLSSGLKVPHTVIYNQTLPVCAAVLERCNFFLGHDSGISHLAAAVGIPCQLLFGVTDPDVWAPPGAHVKITRSVKGMESISVDEVLNRLQRRFLQRDCEEREE
ncbi:MAG: glycosyltransferase family 9 protein [Methylacidiphilales bacterium]|nr:glycosyltransferase family 9 protein [Candidatus Methylacidiphilales bacterium]